MCTLGPATSSERRIRELVYAGMDVARLNMSHGTHEDHATAYRLVREAADATGRGVGIFADLQGPKIRLATFEQGHAILNRGQRWTITTRVVPGDNEVAGTTYQGLPGDVKPGDPILIDDGKVRLRVVSVDGTDVLTEVLVGGPVSNHKGINLPGVAVSVPALSEKDIVDLRFALRLGVDFIALSFVRDAKDAEDVRVIMREEGQMLPIIAKIEKPQAIDNLDEVIAAFDGFMVARGDLAVECPLEDVPFLQKTIVQKARLNAKPVIVATQMLESMITSPSPTRAEASDVANAVLDGADAVMLSGETSVGDHPIHTVETMARIIAATEGHALDKPGPVASARSTGTRTPAAASSRRQPPRSRSASVRRTSSPSPRAATPRGGCRACAVPSPRSPSPPRTGCGRSCRSAGESRRSARRASTTPTRWCVRSTSSCCRSAACRRATWSSSSPAARPASPARPTHCASTGWATRSTRSRRPTAGPDLGHGTQARVPS